MIEEVKVTVKYCSQCPKFIKILIGENELKGTKTGYCRAMSLNREPYIIQEIFKFIVPYWSISDKCPLSKKEGG